MAAPSDPDAVMQARADLRAKRVTLIAAIDAEAKARVVLEDLLRTEPEDSDDPENYVVVARQELAARVQELADARAAERTSRTTLATAIATWLEDDGSLISPQADVQRLLPAQVIVMFPARLETRFGSTPAANLRVRVYPDELSLDTHERALKSDERTAGEVFYMGLDLTDLAEQRKRWQTLAGRFGAPRAAYIVRALRPLMQQDGPEPPYSPCTSDWMNDPPILPLDFPDLPSRPDVWTRPGEAVLPDRWVLVGYRGGKQVFFKTGNPIPEPLPLTLDPGGGETTTDDGFLIDPDLLWSIEYGTAEQIGMAITVTTADDPGVAQGYDRLVLVGVKSSLVPLVEDGAVDPPGGCLHRTRPCTSSACSMHTTTPAGWPSCRKGPRPTTPRAAPLRFHPRIPSAKTASRSSASSRPFTAPSPITAPRARTSIRWRGRWACRTACSRMCSAPGS